MALETPQTYNVQYLVVAGGAGGSSDVGGGGGAGGMRLVATKSFSVCKGATIPVTVGGGGAKSPAPTACGNAGTTSVFSTITSAGGGGGGGSPRSGNAGGSGGGGSRAGTAVQEIRLPLLVLKVIMVGMVIHLPRVQLVEEEVIAVLVQMVWFRQEVQVEMEQ